MKEFHRLSLERGGTMHKRYPIQKRALIALLTAVATALSSCGVRLSENKTAESATEIMTTTPGSERTEALPSSIVIDFEDPENNGVSEKILRYMNSVEFHGVVLAARDGEVIFKGAYGYADHREKTATRTDTVFELGSITKQFTAVAVMMLVEQGKLSLDDPISLYIPEYPYADGITVRNLLSMTSGIPDYVTCGALGFGMEDIASASNESLEALGEVRSIIEKEYTPAEIVRLISDYSLLFEPGEEFAYSNTNYYFLGIIIEKISGVSYFDFIEENFFIPLGMDHTSTETSSLTSKGAILLYNGAIYLPSQNKTLSFAAGSICSDARDLLLWENAVLDGKFLTPDGWAQMFDPGRFGYGFGWHIQSGYYEHSGNTVGYNSHVLIKPESKIVVIALSNTQGLDEYYTDGRVKSDRVCKDIYTILSGDSG